jgi:hypothetical protein
MHVFVCASWTLFRACSNDTKVQCRPILFCGRLQQFLANEMHQPIRSDAYFQLPPRDKTLPFALYNPAFVTTKEVIITVATEGIAKKLNSWCSCSEMGDACGVTRVVMGIETVNPPYKVHQCISLFYQCLYMTMIKIWLASSLQSLALVTHSTKDSVHHTILHM